MDGEVSFWRDGAQDWTPAALNMPLAPGDVLYAGPNGTVEVQLAPAIFARATYNTQLALDNQEADFVQLRITGGQSSLDVRRIPQGFTVEVDTPSAALTVDRTGYYRVDVGQDAASFATHRGGSATVTPAGGGASPLGPNQQVALTGVDSPQVALGAAPPLSAWDNWNSQRTDYVIQPASARYVAQGTYGTEALDRHGTWKSVESYGSVWVPSGVAPGWVPYSTGRWIWDPRFGWTWLDEAPWGWAPYHYGRWVFVSNYWAWAPGPVIVRPAYSPALVVFLGGVSVGRPLCWAPLAWGEPLTPWWGRPGFIGVPSWRGWGGPHVVNNVVIERTTTINVTNINVYKNVTVNKAVVGLPADRFGRGEMRPTRIDQAQLAELRPVHGAVEARPVPASLTPGTGHAVKPPQAIRDRTVVATRKPPDFASTLREHGLTPSERPSAPRIVPAPKPERVRPNGPQQPAREVKPSTQPARPDRNVQQPRPERNVERPRPPGAPTPGPNANAPGPGRGKVAEPPSPPPPPGREVPGVPNKQRRPSVVDRPEAVQPKEPVRQGTPERRPAPNVERPPGKESRGGAPQQRGPVVSERPGSTAPPREPAPQEHRPAPSAERPTPPSTGGSPKDGKPPAPGAANQTRPPQTPSGQTRTTVSAAEPGGPARATDPATSSSSA
jgi:hypothetical protein